MDVDLLEEMRKGHHDEWVGFIFSLTVDFNLPVSYKPDFERTSVTSNTRIR